MTVLPAALAQDDLVIEEIAVMNGHESTIKGVTWSPDGKLIASISFDDTGRVWDVETEETLFVMDTHTDAIHGVAFSPDGTQVVTGSKDKTLRFWDVETGDELSVLDVGEVVLGVVWFEAGLGIHIPRAFRLIDVEGEIIFGLSTSSIQFEPDLSPDATQLALAYTTTEMGIFDIETEEIQELPIDVDPFVPNKIDWANEASAVASISTTDGIAVWSTETTEVLYNEEELETLYSVALSQDGQWLVYGDAERRIRFVHIETGEIVLEVETDSLADAIEWSPDGTMLAVGWSDRDTNYIKIYSVDS